MSRMHPGHANRACREAAAARRAAGVVVGGKEALSRGELARRLAALPPDSRDLTGQLLGDPLPGRSALDRRTPDAGSRQPEAPCGPRAPFCGPGRSPR